MNDLRVAFDREIFVRQSSGGISRYFANLIREFSSNPEFGVAPRLLFSRNSNVHLSGAVPELVEGMPPLRRAPRGVPRLLNRSDPLKDAFLRYRAGPAVAGDRSDWIHATWFRPMPTDIRSGQLLACTVYDLIPELLGLDTTKGPHQGKLDLASRADLILAISHATGEHLTQIAPGLADRIVVVPLGVDAEFFQLPGSRPDAVDFPYVLFLGARTAYKRFDLAVEAVRRVRAKGLDIGLLVAGSALSSDELRQLASLPRDRVRSITPADEALPGIYQHATALVLASEMEGFGLPMLEAFAAGCPVVATDIPVFREVGQQVPRYFVRGDAEALARQLEQLCSSDTEAMRVAGRSRAAQMTWSATAAQTSRAYRSFM